MVTGNTQATRKSALSAQPGIYVPNPKTARYTFYRGLTRVSNWVRLKFAAMNLKKLASWKARKRSSRSASTFLTS
jgi:hypothetical protein